MSRTIEKNLPSATFQQMINDSPYDYESSFSEADIFASGKVLTRIHLRKYNLPTHKTNNQVDDSWERFCKFMHCIYNTLKNIGDMMYHGSRRDNTTLFFCKEETIWHMWTFKNNPSVVHYLISDSVNSSISAEFDFNNVDYDDIFTEEIWSDVTSLREVIDECLEEERQKWKNLSLEERYSFSLKVLQNAMEFFCTKSKFYEKMFNIEISMTTTWAGDEEFKLWKSKQDYLPKVSSVILTEDLKKNKFNFLSRTCLLQHFRNRYDSYSRNGVQVKDMIVLLFGEDGDAPKVSNDVTTILEEIKLLCGEKKVKFNFYHADLFYLPKATRKDFVPHTWLKTVDDIPFHIRKNIGYISPLPINDPMVIFHDFLPYSVILTESYINGSPVYNVYYVSQFTDIQLQVEHITPEIVSENIMKLLTRIETEKFVENKSLSQ
jgi:hypothetical protein